jgi:hypothetical protein
MKIKCESLSQITDCERQGGRETESKQARKEGRKQMRRNKKENSN